jgi:hypothetical protein
MKSIRKKYTIILCLFVLTINSLSLFAQDNEEKPSIKIGGYILTETYYDSYMSLDSRDGEIYFYPLRKKLDIDGNDKNKVGQLEMLGLQSRLRVGVTGGKALGAKVSGLLEADFLGTASDYKFMFRLRHAIVKLDWEKTQVLMGQYWHPTIIPELSPNTVLFACVVFNPLNRPTQIRVTRQLAPNLKVMGAISMFAAHRPSEPAGTNTQRNSGLPESNLQVQIGNTSSLFASVTGGYKFLKPYLTTPINKDTSFAATKIVGSYHISATAGYSMSLLAIRMQCTYGENLTSFNMIGGYAPIKGSRNAKGEYDYTNMNTLTYWGDMETKGSKVRFGIFAGYSENLGTKDSVEFIKNSDLGIDTKKDLCRNDADLQSVYRVSPRVYFLQGPVTFGFEYSITGANYGTFSGKKITNVVDKSVNHRFMMTVKYTF